MQFGSIIFCYQFYASKITSFKERKFENIINFVSNKYSTFHASQWSKNCTLLIQTLSKETKNANKNNNNNYSIYIYLLNSV
jgi:hypothetical protein